MCRISEVSLFNSIFLNVFCQWKSSYSTNANNNWSGEESTNLTKLGSTPKTLNLIKSDTQHIEKGYISATNHCQVGCVHTGLTSGKGRKGAHHCQWTWEVLVRKKTTRKTQPPYISEHIVQDLFGPSQFLVSTVISVQRHQTITLFFIWVTASSLPKAWVLWRSGWHINNSASMALTLVYERNCVILITIACSTGSHALWTQLSFWLVTFAHMVWQSAAVLFPSKQDLWSLMEQWWTGNFRKYVKRGGTKPNELTLSPKR